MPCEGFGSLWEGVQKIAKILAKKTLANHWQGLWKGWEGLEIVIINHDITSLIEDKINISAKL